MTVFASSDLFHNGLLATQAVASGGNSVAYSLDSLPAGDYFIAAFAAASPESLNPSTPIGVYQGYARVTVPEQGTVTGKDFSLGLDNTAPSSAFSSPVSGSTLAALGLVQGTATDNAALDGNIWLAAQDLSNGQWWDSQGHVWVSTNGPLVSQANAQVQGDPPSVSWSVDLSTQANGANSLAGNLTPGHQYRLYERVQDLVGNSQAQPAALDFSFAQASSTMATLSGTISNPAGYPSGSTVFLMVSTNGFSTQPQAIPLTAGGGQSLAFSLALPAPGSYMIGALMGNPSQITSASPMGFYSHIASVTLAAGATASGLDFTIATDPVLPTASITSIVDGSTLTALSSLQGASQDNVAATVSVQLAAQDLATGLWWNSQTRQWVQSASPVYAALNRQGPLSESAAWSVDLATEFGDLGSALSTGHYYRLYVLARDFAGNVSSQPAQAGFWWQPGSQGPLPPGSIWNQVLGTSSVAWNWSLVSDATAYAVYESSSGPLLASVANTSFTLTGLAPNQGLSLCVASIVAAVESARNCSAEVHTWAAVPAAPYFAAVTSYTAALAWDPAGNASGTLYRAMLSTNAFSSVFASLDSTQTFAAFQGLPPATPLLAVVQAANNDSVWSGASTSASTATSSATWDYAPAAPSGGQGVAQGPSSILWTWSAVSSAQGYKVYLGTAVAGSVATTSFLQIGLSTASPNSICVSAYNAAGESGCSWAFANTAAAVPGAPSLLSASTGSVTVYWDARGNPGTVSFQVLLSTDDFVTSGSTAIPFSAGLHSAMASVSGLEPATSYYLRVQARNMSEEVTPASESGLVRTGEPAPLAPLGLLASADQEQRRVVLSWQAAAGGTPAVSFNVHRLGLGLLASGVTSTLYVDASSLASATYYYQVAGVNAAGLEGPASESASVAVDFTAPAPVSDLRLAAARFSSGEADLAWTAPADDFTGTEGYALFMSTEAHFDADSSSVVLPAMAPGQTASATVPVSSSAATYFMLRSRDRAGNVSAPSNTVLVDPVPPVLGSVDLAEGSAILRPRSVSVQALDNVALSSAAVFVDGVLASSAPAVGGMLAPLFLDSRLFEDGSRSIVVTVYDSFGNQAAMTRSATLAYAPPAAPAIYAPAQDFATAVATINVSGSCEPLPGIGVQVQANGVDLESAACVNGSWSITPVTLPVEGDVSLTALAFEARGFSGRSLAVDGSYSSHAPQAPEAPAISAGAAGQALLEWSAPSQGAAPSYYRVYRATDDSLLSAGGPAPAQSLRVANRLTQRSFSDTPPSDNLYFYGITAVDGAGNESPLSEVVYALTDRQPPSAQLLIASAPPLGQGPYQASLVLSEVLQQAPLATFTPPNGQPAALELVAVSATLWQATVTITAAMGSGAAVFAFEGMDLAGNTGTALSSATWAIRTAGPAGTLALSKASPVGAGPLALTLSLDEPSAAAPSLSVTPQGHEPVQVALAAAAPWDNTAWSGSLAIDSNTGDGPAAIAYSAADALGNQSTALSAGATFFAIDTVAPGTPLSLNHHGLQGGQVRLSWSWNSLAGERPVQYKVYRDLSLVASVAPGEDSSGSYTDTPNDEDTHSYRVTALDPAGNESPAAELSAAADVTPPPAPAGLGAASVGTEIELAWQASPGALTYDLYRTTYAITDLSGLTPIKLGAAAPYRDQPVADAVYHYAVAALDGVGNRSLPSGEAAIVFDKGLPSVAILGVSDNAFYKADVAPAFTVTDLILDPASVSALLDGQSFASGATVSAEGSHTLTVSGANTAGRTATSEVSFTIDKTAPAISFSLAQDASVTSTSPISIQVQVSDLNPGASTFLLVNQTLATSVPFQTGQAITRNGRHQLQASAADLAGNASTATLAFTFEIGPLAPAGLSVKVRNTARLSWSSPEPDVIAYRVYRDNSRISASLLTDTSFEDTGYTASGHVYEVSAVDAAGVEGPRARATVPAAVLSLQAPVLTRGFFDALHPMVRNEGAGSLSVGPASLTLLTANGPAASASAPAVTVPAGQTGTLEGVVATPLGLAAGTLRVSVALPTDAGAEALLEGDFPVQAQDPAQPVLEASPGALVLGTLSPVQVRLYNRGSAAMDVVTAEVRNSTFAATDAVQVSLQTPQGTVLGAGGLLQTGNGANSAMLAGRQVFFVSIPPKSSFLFDPVNVVVPNTASGSLAVTASVSTPCFSLPFAALPGAREFSSSAEQATVSRLSYVATSQPERAYYDQGSSVTVRGQALDALSGVPVPNMSVAVHVMSNGFDRQVSAVTDSSGSYSAAFFPLPNEAGLYTVSAANPAVVNLAAQATFTIVGMGLQYSGFAATLAQNSSYAFTVDLTNIGASELTGLSASGAVLSGSGLSLSIDPGSVPSVLAAGAKAALSVTVAAAPAASSGTLSLTVSEAHGFMRVMPITATVVPAQAIGLVTPQQFELGMVGGDVRTVALVIQNKGFETWRDVSVTDPSLALNWARIQGRTGQVSLGDIPPGGNANVTLEFSPPVGSPNQTYSPSPLLQILSANLSPLPVLASVAVTSSRKGDLLVTVINGDKPRNESGQGEPLPGASVTLTSLDVGGLLFPVAADANGLAQFSQVPSGNYTWRVEAKGFDTMTGTVVIEPGLTSHIEATMPTTTVSYRWTVTPTTIHDEYSITLAMEFRTDVPAPAIVVDPPRLNLTMSGGQTLYTQLTITNRGLVSALDYEIEAIGDPAIRIELPFNTIPEIKAGQSVSVPVKVTLIHASCHPITISGKYKNDQICGKRVSRKAPDSDWSVGDCGGSGNPTLPMVGGGWFSTTGSGAYVGVQVPGGAVAPQCSDTQTAAPPSSGTSDPGSSSPGSGGGGSFGDPAAPVTCHGSSDSTDITSGQHTTVEDGLDAGTPLVALAPTAISGPRVPSSGWGKGGSLDPNNNGIGVLPPPPGFDSGFGWQANVNPYISLIWGPDGSVYYLYHNGSGAENLLVPLGPLEQSIKGPDSQFSQPINTHFSVTAACPVRGGETEVCRYDDRHYLPTSMAIRNKDGVVTNYGFFPCEKRVVKSMPAGSSCGAPSGPGGMTVPTASPASTGTYILTQRVDSNGNVVDYKRNPDGKLTQIADGFGHRIDLQYNSQGQVQGMSDQTNRSVGYAYDAAGNKTAYTDTNGDTTHYDYDSDHRITQITYPNGGHTYYTYDAEGRVATRSYDSGVGSVAFSYSTATKQSSVTDVLGRVTRYEWTTKSGMNKITKVTDPVGGAATFTYDGDLNLLSATDSMGRMSSFQYDKSGNVLSVTDPSGGTVQATYEPVFSQPLTVTDPKGNEAKFTYDARGNLIEAADALGNKDQFSYDRVGNLLASKDALGNVTSLGYDSYGVVTSVTDALGRTEQMSRDSLGRLIENTDPAGKKTVLTYDNEGSVLQVKDAFNKVTALEYAPGRGGKVPSALTDAVNNRTSFSYDGLGRVTGMTDAAGHTMSATYDQVNRLASVTTRKNQSVNLTYDTLDRLTQVSLPEGNITATYDAVDNVLSEASYNGSGLAMEYDSLDRVKKVVQTLPNNYSAQIEYAYDTNGNRTSMTTPWGVFSYGYDSLNRVTRITNPQGKVISFTYDALGRRKTMSYPNGVIASYAYDAAGQVTQILYKKDATALAFSNYVYDVDGNRVSMTDIDGTHSYGYDTLNRLTSASHPPMTSVETKNETFAYDPVGNRLSDAQISGYQYGAGNRLIENSSFTYTYDANGNQNSRTERTTNKETNYSYNSVNQLVGATLPDGTQTSYKYDSVGRRIEKSTGSAQSPAITRFIYDGQNIIATLDGNNNLVALYTQGPGIDQPLIMHKSDGTEYFMHGDALGSVVAHTDTNGNVVERVVYEAYGKPTFVDLRGAPIMSTTSLTGSPFAFTGRIWESETGLYDSRFRQTYDPMVGRFGQEDPIGFAGKDVNSYAYARNSPALVVDPLGLYGLGDFGGDLGNGIGGFGDGASLGAIGTMDGFYNSGSYAYQIGRGFGYGLSGALVVYGLGQLALGYTAYAIEAAAAMALARAARNLQELLMPGGKPLGNEKLGSRPEFREVAGGLDDAEAMLSKLAQGGAPKSGYPGKGFDLPNGGFVGLRTLMTKSPGATATIDVNIPGIPAVRKIKFCGGGL